MWTVTGAGGGTRSTTLRRIPYGIRYGTRFNGLRNIEWTEIDPQAHELLTAWATEAAAA